jgi:hypothetical protein
LALAATDTFGAELSITRESALEALEAVGRVGFTGQRLNKSEFPRNVYSSGPPLQLWQRILNQYKKTPGALAGAFFVFLLVSELNREDAPPEEGDERGATRDGVIHSILNSRAFKKLAMYPEITRFAAESVFEMEQPIVDLAAKV